MLFNSLSFAVFFPTVVILYYLLPDRFRPLFLLAASCIFYMAFVPSYVLILFAVITLDFFLAQLIVRAQGRRRLLYLWCSIGANLGILFFFKYFNFFNVNVAALADFLNWNYDPLLLTVALPLGLSFHIFQSLAYVIEVYKGRYQPELNYLRYSLYVMFFPQLVAGPIERPSHLLPQIRVAHSFDATRVRRGLERMLWGLFKKLVIADNIAVIVDSIWASGTTDGPLIILAAILFTFQIYCDFSGYSDIAVGTALVLGYDIMENFNRPFAARTMAEFWRRWHISLSNWLRDYLYYPLAFSGKQVTKLRLHASLFLSMVLIGLWHGAAWTFVMFGTLNGIYLTVGLLTASWREKFAVATGLAGTRLQHALQVVVVFLLFTLCLVFFRSQSFAEAWHLISHVGNNLGIEPLSKWFLSLASIDKVRMAVLISAIAFMEGVQYWQAKKGSMHVLEGAPKYLRYGSYYLLIGAILFLGYFKAQPFIYFQF